MLYLALGISVRTKQLHSHRNLFLLRHNAKRNNFYLFSDLFWLNGYRFFLATIGNKTVKAFLSN